MKTEFAAPAIIAQNKLRPLALACLLACSAILGVASTAPVAAQVSVSINLDSNIASQEWEDPPGRVGRLSYLSGDVSFFGDNQEGWARGRLNYPVSNENSVWTGRNGRAEFRVGAQAVRVDEETVIDVLNMTDNATVLFLQRGVVNIRVRDLSRGDSFWIDTAEGRLAIRANGRYRVETDAQNGETRFTVFSGSARVESDGTQRGLERNTTLSVRGGGNINDSRYERSIETSFDRWAANRDRDDDFNYARVVRDRVVSPYMTGYEDLNANGDWIDDNEYGRIWAPRVTIASWAPYRYGHWTYARRWGWTWVDDAAWGFAPFHYGRWLFTSNRWCWSPGSYVHRPVYAPALVGWHGNFSHAGHHNGRNDQRHDGRNDGRHDGRDPLSNALNGRGAVGWFPLSPNDRFAPSYTSNQNYVRNVNSGWGNRAATPSNRFQNQTPGATFVARDTFLNASPITAQATISASDIMRGGVAPNGFNNTFTTAAPTLLPGRFRGGNAPAQPNNPGAGSTPPVFVGNNNPTSNSVGGGRPNMQPVQPTQQVQMPQPQQPGRPTAADIMRGGVSLNRAPVAVPAPAPAPTPNFGSTGGRLPQQVQPSQPAQSQSLQQGQPRPQAQPQPMPLPGREALNQGISGGRPVAAQPSVQVPQTPSALTNQPSAPVYSRLGYAAPTVAPSQNAEAPTGFRRDGYASQAPRVSNESQRSKAEMKADTKVEPKAERETKPAEQRPQDFRGPVRGQVEKPQ